MAASTFECLAARVSAGAASCVVVYRPDSSAVTATFLAELADVLDRLLTFVDPAVLAGDVNIRLERTCDPHSVEFSDLIPVTVLSSESKSQLTMLAAR